MRTRILALIALVLTGLIVIPARAAEPTELDSYLAQQVQRNNIRGMAAVIVEGDAIVLAEGYGTLTADTPFYIGSVSKSFTALGVLQLVDAGLVDLDAPVVEYVPDFTVGGDTADAITVRHLLTHQSGLADRGYQPTGLPPDAAIAARVADLESATPVAEPGAEYHYFNANYTTLGRLIEVVSGESYTTYMQTNIFDPLAMTNTTTDPSGLAIPTGTADLFGIAFPVEAEFSRPDLPNGYIISTAADLGNYLIMQQNGGAFEGEQILSPELVELMHTAPENFPYAMGWFDQEVAGMPALTHGGSLPGYHADATLLQTDDVAFALLYTNNDLPFYFSVYPGIQMGIVELMTDGDPAPARRIGTDLIILAIGALRGGLSVRRLLTVDRWTERNADKPRPRVLASVVIGVLVPILLIIFLPALGELVSQRDVTWAILGALLPEVFLGLALGLIVDAASAVARVRALA
ncbi:MAG: serine hydrolase domain-containing protein [Anaerolineae bacterium]